MSAIISAMSAESKPRIVYIHGDGVTHWSWRWVACLRDELVRRGFPTFFELLPDSIDARAHYWVPFLEEHARVSDEDVLIGWSCGAVAALRVAERHRVRGLALIAPYYTDLGLPMVRDAGWVGAPWNWPLIKANAPSIAIFHSDNDPYISADELATLAREVATEVHVIAGAGHFAEQDTFPELLEHIERHYG